MLMRIAMPMPWVFNPSHGFRMKPVLLLGSFRPSFGRKDEAADEMFHRWDDDGNVRGMPITPDFKQLARIGAQIRLGQLESERAAILTAYPELRRSELVVSGNGQVASPGRRK